MFFPLVKTRMNLKKNHYQRKLMNIQTMTKKKLKKKLKSMKLKQKADLVQLVN